MPHDGPPPKEYKWMSYSEATYWEALAAARGVSEVARSRRGFFTQFKKAKGKFTRIPDEWRWKRHNFIKRHLAQMRKNSRPFYGEDGLPTRQHLALIMWAYTSQPKRVARIGYEFE